MHHVPTSRASGTRMTRHKRQTLPDGARAPANSGTNFGTNSGANSGTNFGPLLAQETPSGVTFAKYELDRRQLSERLAQRAGNLAFYSDRFNPYPVVVSDDLIAQVERANELTVRGVIAVVTNYFDDPAIQNILRLPPDALAMLRVAAKRPYHIGRIGALRPDFLIDQSGQIRLCEINARFATNGFVMSQYLAEVFAAAPYGRPTIDPCFDAVTVLSSDFDLAKPITIIKRKERGYDIHYLRDELRKASDARSVHFCPPEALALRNGALHNGVVFCDQYVLELHQDELMSLPRDVIEALVTKATYFNDVRTVLIAHDKRLFAILTNREIMSKYVSDEDVRDLRRFFIPTYLVDDENVAEQLRASPARWVLKKYLSGKGEDMFVGREDRVSMLEFILKNSASAYTVQPYIDQALFDITTTHREIETAPNHVVGLIPSYNGKLLGPGMFRASTGDVVNVSRRGGDILTPVTAVTPGR